MSRTVMPAAYRPMIMPSRPPSLPEHFGTSPGVNEPSRSRGTWIVTGPTSVARAFGYEPFLEFAEPLASLPAQSPGP